jgi:hypothetical protein
MPSSIGEVVLTVSGTARTRASSTVRPAGSPSRIDRRAPARPAKARAISVNATRAVVVNREYGQVKSSKRSANVTEAHEVSRQRNRRTVRRSSTRRPHSAVSTSRR